MRTPLTLLVGALAVVLSLYAAWIQCRNFELAGELDSLTKDSAWLERCVGEEEERLAELTYQAERALARGERASQGSATEPEEPVEAGGETRLEVPDA